jgi:acyl-CoA thioester hydrolase
MADSLDIRIYYEDTDCGGVVYYANYLKYFERARTHYLEERGFSVAAILKEGTQFMVVHAELDYRSPARCGDTLVIETTLTESGKASLTFAHVIREKTSHRIILEGSAKLVSVNMEGRVKRLDPVFVEALQASPRRAMKERKTIRKERHA